MLQAVAKSINRCYSFVRIRFAFTLKKDNTFVMNSNESRSSIIRCGNKIVIKIAGLNSEHYIEIDVQQNN